MGPQDEVGFIQPPQIPVELRSLQLDLEAMEQRGGPSWTMFGSIQQRMTAFAAAQVAATTNQLAKAFHRGIVDLYSDMDNFFLQLIKRNNYAPYGMTLPQGLPDNARLTATYELRIPGDLTQRATTARILNPDFELSEERIMDELFPEITDPTKELSDIRASKARQHPIYAQLSLAEALRAESQLLKGVGDFRSAELFDKAADRMEAEITGEGQQQLTTPQRDVRVRPEVQPPRDTQDARGVR